jgi:transcriptional regulator with XRE-family HTH domain
VEELARLMADRGEVARDHTGWLAGRWPKSECRPEELARRAGMTQSALSRLERGGGVPTIAVLDRIAHALHATLNVSIIRAA